MEQKQRIAFIQPPQTTFTATLWKMASAGTAASIAEIVTIPMDTTKVRLQVCMGRGL